MVNKETEKSVYEINEENWFVRGLYEFFWFCSGADRKILRQCPTEYSKYFGIGGTIFFTAAMATLSGGYAMGTVFDTTWKIGTYDIPILAICFGIFWGLLIFNLDRFIVNTMYSDGTHKVTKDELKLGSPRIVIAFFLGIVISTPLELKIFEDAIDIRIEQDKDALIKEKISATVHERDSLALKRDDLMNGVTMFDSQITTSSVTTNELLSRSLDRQNELTEVQTKISRLNSTIRQLKTRLEAMDQEEPSRSSITSQLDRETQKRSALIARRNTLNADIRQITGEIAASDNTLKNLLQQKQGETQKEVDRLKFAVDSLNRVISDAQTRHVNWSDEDIKLKGSFRDKLDVEYKGFQARMNAFSELKRKSENHFWQIAYWKNGDFIWNSTKTASFFIMLLFIIIEIAPTIFKMMLESGPYDELLNEERSKIKAEAIRRVSQLNDEVNTQLKISNAHNEAKLIAEAKANEELMTKIAAVQAELLDSAIEEWRKEELAKIKADPSRYIKSNTRKG